MTVIKFSAFKILKLFTNPWSDKKQLKPCNLLIMKALMKLNVATELSPTNPQTYCDVESWDPAFSSTTFANGDFSPYVRSKFSHACFGNAIIETVIIYKENNPQLKRKSCHFG